MRIKTLHWRGRITYLVTVMLISLALMGIGIAWWAAQAAEPMPEALTALMSNPAVTVDYAVWLTFTPTTQEPTTGLIFYPGARIDPRAYAPAAQAIAAAGYFVVIVPMPLNLAILGVDQAAEVMAAYPTIDHWAIAGHSFGGAIAAKFVANHPAAVESLILWAAYPAARDSLAQRSDLAITSIYATLDGLATVADIEAARAYLPPTAGYVAVEGGNHAQFGWYGAQTGDHPATLTRLEQQEIVITATLATLAQ